MGIYEETMGAEQLMALVDADDVAVNGAEVLEQVEPDALSVAFMINRHPLLGGDYYRAYRPAALSSLRFGWATSLADRMVESGKRLGYVTPAGDKGRVFFSDVLVLRPVGQWHLDFVQQAHANGQKVIADLDDNLWGHEDWSKDDLEAKEDFYNEWFPYVDAYLCSTKWLVDKVRSFGYPGPAYYAPNCYDTTALNASPKPSRRLGTRLWLSGRQQGDVDMYDDFVYPLLDKLDMSFTHIGAMEDGEASVGIKARRSFGWDTPRLIERPSLPITAFHTEFERFSIGTIMMCDNEYNRAKTDTHAVELASAGLPLVSASPHELYRKIPGTVALTAEAVERRVKELIDPETWWIESKRARTWARQRAVACESQYLSSLLAAVNALMK